MRKAPVVVAAVLIVAYDIFGVVRVALAYKGGSHRRVCHEGVHKIGHPAHEAVGVFRS